MDRGAIVGLRGTSKGSLEGVVVNSWMGHGESWLQSLTRDVKYVDYEIRFILCCFIHSSRPRGSVLALVGLCGDSGYISMWVHRTGRKEGVFPLIQCYFRDV